MKKIIIVGFTAASVLLAGCKKEGSSGGSGPTAKEKAGTSAGVAQPALTAWQRGDKSTAISSFVDADWSDRPLFAPESVLNLSEAQFKALSAGDRQAKSDEMLPQIASLKQVGAAVAQVGRDAGSKGDAAQARKYFTSLKACGTALDNPGCLLLVQKVGKSLNETAERELAKIGQ